MPRTFFVGKHFPVTMRSEFFNSTKVLHVCGALTLSLDSWPGWVRTLFENSAEGPDIKPLDIKILTSDQKERIVGEITALELTHDSSLVWAHGIVGCDFDPNPESLTWEWVMRGSVDDDLDDDHRIEEVYLVGTSSDENAGPSLCVPAAKIR
jgi:hypothetical protein